MKSIHRFLRHTRAQKLNFFRHRSGPAAAVNEVDVKDARPFEEIPGPRGIYNIPVFGAMFHFKPFTNFTVHTVAKLFSSLVDKYGSLVRIRLGEWAVLVEDPADIAIVMKSEGKYPHRRSVLLQVMYSERTGYPLGLGNLQGEEWHNFRNPVNPRMMRAKSAQYYLPAQNQVADDLVDRLKKPITPEEMTDLFFKYACESISVVVYNKRLGYLDPDVDQYPEKLQAIKDISTLLELIIDSSNIPPFVMKNFPLKIKKDFDEIFTRLVTHAEKYYKDTIEEIKIQQKEGTLNMEENNFLLSLMLTERLTPEQMAVTAVDLYGAGTDSTAKNLQMVLYNLAKNQDKQQKLYEEILGALGPTGPLTIENQAKLSYLLACVRESFRLIFPALSGSQRYLPNDIVLQGYRIPAGTSIMLMNQKTLKNEKHFPDPESYIPERWLRSEDGKRSDPIPSSAYLPFGFGPRQCIGKRFAEQEIYLAVVKILQHFRSALSVRLSLPFPTY